MTAWTVFTVAFGGFGVSPPPPPTPSPPVACVVSSNRWHSSSFAPQDGTFSVEFAMIPGGARVNSITGLSFGRANEYTDLAATVRFSPEGAIDSRNGAEFAARTSLSYKAGARYQVRMVVRVRAHTYDVYVTPPGGAEQALALNHAFRSEQEDVDALNHWAVFARAGSHQTCEFSGPRADVAANVRPVEDTTPPPVEPAPVKPPPVETPARSPGARGGRGGGAGATAVLVGAGDIGNCGTETDQATARLLDRIEGTIFTVGDNAYPDGSAENFARCFEPTWGRHRDRMRPSPGNHDYRTSGAQGYFEYFSAKAGPRGRGYYSYGLGAWHIVALNSNVSVSSNSPQVRWLRQDLAANPATCTLAYWHEPRFSSGEHGNSAQMQPLWEALYEAGADVILVGHDHNYERFAPQSPDGRAEPRRGIRQFVVGTGGTRLRGMQSRVANSEVRNSNTHGLLKLVLHPNSYQWEFIPVAGQSFTDKGTGQCH